MYIHLGGDMILRSNKIIAILDKQIKELSQDNRMFFQNHKKQKNIISVSDDEPMSIVITDDEIYYSPISSLTLKRRTEIISEIEEDESILSINGLKENT